MIKDRVKQLIEEKTGQSIVLLTPKDISHGDYAINVHQIHISISDTSKIIDDLKHEQLFESVTQEGSFINLLINKKYLTGELQTILSQGKSYGQTTPKNPKKIHLEYGQPNTHKLPHIGHLFSYIYGESLAKLLTSTGNDVLRTNYQGDVGPHVAKCLYVVKLHMSDIEKFDHPAERAAFLQMCYQKGSKLYDENPEVKEEIDNLNKKIYQNDPDVYELWQTTRQWSLDYYKAFEERLGIHYDKYYFESETGPVGKKLVEDHIGSVFEKSEGAVVFRGEKYGSHTRVFITKAGNPTYEAKDIGTEFLKYKDWPFDQAIITTASEQNGYFKVVIQAINETLPELNGKVKHIGFGLIDLKQGKMSSRTGNIVSAIDLVDSVKELAKDLKDSDDISEIISLGAIKYSFLKSDAMKNISFDLKESISIHGNSGPYIQYSYARCKSILDKASDIKKGSLQESSDNDLLPEESHLLRTLFRFPEVVAEAAASYSPHLVATYLFDITQKFNAFYEKCPVLNASKDEQALRLALVEATSIVLKNGLFLLGIEVVEKI